MKPFAESCEQNKEPILEVLREAVAFASAVRVLEIGSGTGQHAVHFAAALPRLMWQTSDVAEHHAGIRAWLADGPANALPPLRLDVRDLPWPTETTGMDAVFSANTTHIMGWPAVECLFEGAGETLVSGGRLALYGPFNYGGRYTSDSNARFDAWLKARDAASGIRDFEALNQLAEANGLVLWHDYEMPANNRILVWEKRPPA